jgi:Cu+-exporting ATPase
MEKVDTLVVDKTGTLTEGRPKVISVVALSGFTEEDILHFAATLEQGSEHPLAAAILAGASERKINPSKVSGFRSVTGKGIVGEVEGRAVGLGNAALFHELSAPLADLAGQAETFRRDGQTVVFMTIDRRPAGLIAIEDPIKESSRSAIAALQKQGVRIVMLTGDNLTTAHSVARQLRIDEVKAEVLPGAKTDVIKSLQKEGRIVAMAGDGINDAPALAQAHAGIAMGSGTDVAIESAGVILVKGDLRGIVRVRRLSRAVMKNIRENLFLAFAYNVIGIPIAAGALYPVFGLLLSPMIASAAMTFSSVSVIGNALRLRQAKL